MKQKLLLLAASFLFVSNAFAAKLTVTATGIVFSPNTGTIHLGDTVLFVWADFVHTTTSTSIPTGALAWDAPLDSVNTSFRYIPTKVGTYNYQCTPHLSMGMTGTFTVAATTGIPAVTSRQLFQISPNPTQLRLYLQINDSSDPMVITITDMLGKQVLKTLVADKSANIDVSALPSGSYFVTAEQNAQKHVERLVVSH